MEGVFEERLRLLCALKVVDPNSFRSINVLALDAIESHTRITLESAKRRPTNLVSESSTYMLNAIVCAPNNAALAQPHDKQRHSIGLTQADLMLLPFLLDEYTKMFEAQLTKKYYQCVHNICETKIIAIKTKLAIAAHANFVNRKHHGIWMSISEINECTMLTGFM